MRRIYFFLLSLVLLVGFGVTGVARADVPELAWTDWTVQDEQNTWSSWTEFAEGSGFSLDNWLFNAGINDYSTLHDAFDCDPEWSVVMTDGPNDDCWNWSCWDGGNNPEGMDIFVNYDNYHPEDGDVLSFDITCAWGGQSLTTSKTVTFQDMDLPVAATAPNLVELTVDEETAFDLDFDPAGYTMNNSGDGHLDIGFYSDIQADYHCEGYTQYITPYAAGRYAGSMALRTGNLRYDVGDVIFEVRDSNGVLPPAPESFDASVNCRGGGRMVVNAIIPDVGGDWYYDSFAGSIDMDTESYDTMRGWYGGAPEWSVVNDAGLNVWLEPQWGADGRRDQNCIVRIDGAPAGEGIYNLCFACDWADKHQEYAMKVSYSEADDAPDGCNIPPVVTLRLGETTEFDWGFNNGFVFMQDYWFPCGLNYDWIGFDELFEMRTEGTHVYITPLQDETDYWFGWINVVDGNVGAGRQVLFRIEDENGNVDREDLLWPIRFEEDEANDNVAYDFAIFDDVNNTFHDSWLRHFSPNDYDRLRDVFGHDPEWWVDVLEEPDNGDGTPYRTDVEVELVEDGRNRYLWVNRTPSEEGYTMFRVNCWWSDDWCLYYDLRVNWVIVDDIPIETNIPRVLELQAGEEAEFSFCYDPDTGFSSRDRINMGLYHGDPEAIGMSWRDNGFDLSIVVDEPGMYSAWIDLIRGNIAVRTDTYLRVADENGFVPNEELTIFSGSYKDEYVVPGLVWDGTPATALHTEEVLGTAWLDPNCYDVLWEQTYTLPDWNVEQTAGEDISYDWHAWYNDDGQDARGITIQATEFPDHAMEAEFTVTCSWNGSTQSAVIPVCFVEHSKPSDLVVDSEICLTAGERAAIDYTILPEGWTYTDDRYFDVWCDIYDVDFHTEYEDGVLSVQVDEPGCYPTNICLRDGSISYLIKDVMFKVADEHGYVPGAEMSLYGGAYKDEYVVPGIMWDGTPETALHTEDVLAEVMLYDEFYTVQRHLTGELPQWTVEQTAGNPIPYNWNIRSEEDGCEAQGIMIQLYEAVEAETVAEFVVTCDWNGYSDTMVITIPFVEHSKPTAFIVDSEIYMTAGEFAEINYTILPEGWTYTDNRYFDIWFDAFNVDSETMYDENGVLSLRIDEPGIYVGNICLRDGSISYLIQNVVFRVADSEGNVPALNPDFDRFYFMDMSLRPEESSLDYWVSEGDVLFLCADNHDALVAYYGEQDYIWSFETVEGPEVDMYASPTDSWGEFDFRISNLDDFAPGDGSVVEATVEYGEGSTTFRIYVNFIRLELPDAINWEDHIQVRAGEIYTVGVEVDPSNWREGFLWYDVEGDVGPYDMWQDENDEYLRYMRFDQPGTYYGWCHIHAYNVFINGPEVVYTVLDENDNEVPPQLHFEHDRREADQAILPMGERETGLWADTFVMEFSISSLDHLLSDFGDVFTGDPVWSVEPIDGTELTARIEHWDGIYTGMVFVDSIPTEETDAAYCVTCEWGGQSAEGYVYLHYRHLPLPEGSNVPDRIVTQVGETVCIEGRFTPDTYDYYQDSYFEIWPNVEANIEIQQYMGDMKSWLTPYEAGVYSMHSNVVAGNIVYSKDFILVVTDENGGLPTFVLPDGLSVIDEEAFAGIAACIVYVPDGVTEIGSRAFADCPNLVEVHIPASVQNIAANAFEGSEFVEIIRD